MTPYYADDYATLYLGDCREVAEWLAADVLITDPPYGLNAQLSHGGKPGQLGTHGRQHWDRNLDARDAALALWGDRPYAVFGSPARLDQPLPCREFPLIWDKLNVGMGDTNFPWGRSYELIYVHGDGWHTGGTLRTSSVLRVQHHTHTAREEQHPSAKPLPLMAELIRKAPPGLIADPFAGSGATLRAAKDLGRHAVGVEIDEAYAEVAAKRLGQDALFIPPPAAVAAAQLVNDGARLPFDWS